MRALGQTLAREFGHNHGIDVRSYLEVIVGSIRRPLQVLLGAVLCVLLIACANVANLLLASGLARRRELADPPGARRRPGDLARQLTLRSAVLAARGRRARPAARDLVVQTFVALAANILPRAGTIRIDGRVLAFTAIVSVLVGVFCGLCAAAAAAADDARHRACAKATPRTAAAAPTFGNGLVVAEIAVAFALLVGAGLMVKNLMLLERRDAGIQTRHVIAFDVAPSGPRYKDARSTFARSSTSSTSACAQVGGVESVGMTSHLPMYRFG